MSYVIVNNKDNTFFSMFRGFVKEYPDALEIKGFKYALTTACKLVKEDPSLGDSLVIISDYGGEYQEEVYCTQSESTRHAVDEFLHGKW